MTMLNGRRRRRCRGTGMVVIVLMLSIGSTMIGAILWGMNSFMRHTERNHYYDRALLLADAGIKAALHELNSGGDGVITDVESRQYFSRTGNFHATDWWFVTAVSSLPGSGKRVTSTGHYRGMAALARQDLSVQSVGETIHALYALAIYAGNSSGDPDYVLEVGGTGSGADYVNGDVHANGDITLSGDALLRNPEDFSDLNGDDLWDANENWLESNATAVYSNGMSQSAFDAYVAGLDSSKCYVNGVYDFGEPFVDEIGNGVYDASEPFEDLNGDGQYGFGEPFTDLNGDGVYNPGEEFTDLGNGQYDQGEEYEDVNGNGQWDPETPGYYEGSGWNKRWVEGTPAEPYEDRGNGVYDEGESFEDVNGVYDEGEQWVDDRNGLYDYGTTATGDIAGMPSPAPGQTLAEGDDPALDPPDLQKMYYNLSKGGTRPGDAMDRWGHDVDVANQSFDSNGRIMNQSNPAHIFVKNPDNRSYTKIPGKDDYFIEDPTDPSYGNSSQYITVQENGNDKVYYVDGNVYLHNPHSYDFMFRDPDRRITIVANGNITISDEFWYNGGTSDPQDGLCLIAMEDPDEPDSGNIYLGDAQFGTGGDIHAMLYAENDFVDNNLDTEGQPYLSVFGNMSAGNHVALNRSGPRRTRLDVTLDERIRDGIDVPPGLPNPVQGQRSVFREVGWEPEAGSWASYSRL